MGPHEPSSRVKQGEDLVEETGAGRLGSKGKKMCIGWLFWENCLDFAIAVSASHPGNHCVSEAPKGRKRKPRTRKPKTPAEPKKPAKAKKAADTKKAAEAKKPAETKKSAKSTKSKEKQEKITDTFKVKRKVDRFNGVSEAELLTKTLPDILTFNLDIVIVRISVPIQFYK